MKYEDIQDSNPNLPDGGEPSAQERMHVLLSAYVFGELEGDELRDVEAALQASPELRAERERLEATTAFVRGALGGRERLSDAATAALTAAAAERASADHPAQQPPILPWYRRPAWRIAASVLAVGGLAVAVNRLGAKGPADERTGSGYELASAAAPDRDAAAEAARRGRGVASLPEKLARQEDQPASEAFDESDAKPRTARSAVPDLEAARAKLDGTANLPVVGRRELGEAPAENAAGSTLAVVGAELRTQDVPKDSGGFVGAVTATEPATETLDALGYGGAYRGAGELTGEVFHDAPLVLETAAGLGGGGGAPAAPAARASGPSTPGPSGQPSPGAALERKRERPGGAAKSTPPPATRGGAARYAYDPAGAAADPAASAEEIVEEAELGLRVQSELVGADFDDDAEAADYLGFDIPVYEGSDDFYLGRRADRRPLNREQLDELTSRVLQDCRRRPHERPRDMFFRFWGDNPFEWTDLDRLSTFAADVDTASYTLARNYLKQGYLPEKAQIRTEEFVNYFKGDLPAPTEETFGIHTELAPSRFGDDANTWMLRVGVRGKDVAKGERDPLALTFVVDVSGSMKEENRLELVKYALRQLTAELDGRDAISLVAFSREARLVLPLTPANQRGLIETALHGLVADGGTNIEAGIKMGYAQARGHLLEGRQHRVVLLSDGVGNIGVTDQERIGADVAGAREAGIYLNTIGVGMDNHNDVFLEQLADRGDGLCNYVDDEKEARRAFVENFTGAFQPIARDVKIQVEFDPAQVERYRLLGYENRAVADADFRNDAVDAGEIGAGHQVVALYELVRRGPGSNGGAEAPLATVRVRYKQPHSSVGESAKAAVDEVDEIEHALYARQASGLFGQASAGFRRSAYVAQFAEFLRLSVHARNDSLDALIDEARALVSELPADEREEFAEFVALVEQSKALVLARRAPPAHADRWHTTRDELRRLRYELDALRARLTALEQQHAGSDRRPADWQQMVDRRAQLMQQIESLEAQLRVDLAQAYGPRVR